MWSPKYHAFGYSEADYREVRWHGEGGLPPARSAVYYRLQEHQENHRTCGIEKEITWHTSRHTMATEICLTNGVPIETLSKMLGHTNIRTTQIYAKIAHEKKSRDMAALSDKLSKIEQFNGITI